MAVSYWHGWNVYTLVRVTHLRTVCLIQRIVRICAVFVICYSRSKFDVVRLQPNALSGVGGGGGAWWCGGWSMVVYAMTQCLGGTRYKGKYMVPAGL